MCQSHITNWWQEEESTYKACFPFCPDSFFIKPYTVLKMICRQKSTDLWKANRKLFSNTHFSASETHFTWSRNSDFLLKITSGTKDYKAYFPKANVPHLSTSDWKQDAECEQRKALCAGMCRGWGEASVLCALTILQKLSPFRKWEEGTWGLDKDILSDTKILWASSLNPHDSQRQVPFSKWSHQERQKRRRKIRRNKHSESRNHEVQRTGNSRENCHWL